MNIYMIILAGCHTTAKETVSQNTVEYEISEDVHVPPTHKGTQIYKINMIFN